MSYPRSCLVSGAIALVFSLQASAEHYKVGDPVEADVMHIGIWKTGVITEVLPFDRYRVQLDEERGRHDPTLCLEQYIRAGGARSEKPVSATGAEFPTGNGSTAGTVFKIGDRVNADVTHIGVWKSGVVTEILPFDRYRVLLDEDRGRYDATVCMKQYIRQAANSSAAAMGAGKKEQEQPLPMVSSAANAAKPLVHTKIQATQSAANKQVSAADSADGLPAGLGAPPSGKYVAQKMSPGGGYIGLGELEIRGNTYRGLSGGNFAPFSVSGGKITWSQGINGMPDGWVIRHSVYRGLDDSRHPYIQVYYRSKSGFNDCFDCVKEK